jgi:hypothetical protein
MADEHLVKILREAFGERLTLSFKDSAKLLNLNDKTLLRHVRCGNIGFHLTGHGRTRQRREFTLEDLAGFYEGAARRVVVADATTAKAQLRTTGRTSFLDGYAARKTMRAAARSK